MEACHDLTRLCCYIVGKTAEESVKKSKIEVQGKEISLISMGTEDYISLTDSLPLKCRPDCTVSI